MLEQLRSLQEVEEAYVVHVCRDFDGDADGVCSETLDMRDSTADREAPDSKQPVRRI